jgi:hypothetical protein
MGKGILGRILDIADKSVYLAYDLEAFLAHRLLDLENGALEGLYQIEEILRLNPFVCDIWERVVVKDDTVAICNPAQLADLLLIRANMFKALYYNPSSRFLEDVIGQVFKYLYNKGEINRQSLLRMTDQELYRLLEERCGNQSLTALVGGSLYGVTADNFDTLEEACLCESELLEDANLMTHIAEFAKPTSNGVKSFHVFLNGKIVTLAEACPRAVHNITKVMDIPTRYCLYILDLTQFKLSKELVEHFRHLRRQRLD